jgi:hypothetical protein
MTERESLVPLGRCAGFDVPPGMVFSKKLLCGIALA